jgi:uncharacterized C2H2 Zn-finger protein
LTPARIGVILEVQQRENFVKKLKCRFCEVVFERMFDLRLHVVDAHHVIYVRFVEPHLYETAQKLYGLETIAQDCMKGFREPTYRRVDQSIDRF